jgi:hypothetical protein
MKVDIDGMELDLPDEQAKALITRRDADKARRREVDAQLAKLTADREAAESARLKAEEDAKLAEAVKTKDIEAVRAAMAAAHKAELERVTAATRGMQDRLVASLVRDTVARHSEIKPEAVAVVEKLLRADYRFSIGDDGTVKVDGAPLGPDGRPKGLEVLTAEFLGSEAGALFRKPAVSQGSGAAGVGSAAPGQKTLSLAAFEALPARERGAFLHDGGKLIGA